VKVALLNLPSNLGTTGHRSVLDNQNYDANKIMGFSTEKYKRVGKYLWDWENHYGSKK